MHYVIIGLIIVVILFLQGRVYWDTRKRLNSFDGVFPEEVGGIYVIGEKGVILEKETAESTLKKKIDSLDNLIGLAYSNGKEYVNYILPLVNERDVLEEQLKQLSMPNDRDNRIRNDIWNRILASINSYLEKLDKGLFDFAVIVENVDLKKYNCLTVHAVDRWGVVMRRDSELSDRDYIEPADLIGKPVLVSRQALNADIPRWLGDSTDKLNVIATLDLTYNGSVLAKEGCGYLLTFEGLTDTGSDSPLCFKPLMPELTTSMHVIWRKHQNFTAAGEVFLNALNGVLLPR